MYFTIIILIFTLCVNFVSATGFFPVEVETGIELNETSGNQTFFTLTGDSTTDLWAIVISGAGAIGLVVAWITRSPAILGVYLFSTVFWISYINMWGITNLGNYIPLAFSSIAHGAMLFLWIGAVAGMLSGGG